MSKEDRMVYKMEAKRGKLVTRLALKLCRILQSILAKGIHDRSFLSRLFEMETAWKKKLTCGQKLWNCFKLTKPSSKVTLLGH